MSCPNEDDYGKPRFRILFQYQDKPESTEVWADSDFAGCQKSRKSTSGGIIRHGKHIIKSRGANQAVVALSSGEAEYYALVKGASGAIGTTNLCMNMGVYFDGPIKAKTDASAAIGIASRLGVGKVRHIEVTQL